jgi:hypothetical protein
MEVKDIIQGFGLFKCHKLLSVLPFKSHQNYLESFMEILEPVINYLE